MLGNKIWEKKFNKNKWSKINSFIETSDNCYLLVGSTNKFLKGSDYWIVKLDNKGNLIWEQKIGSFKNDFAMSVLETSERYFISGKIENKKITFPQNFKYFVICMNKNGKVEWKNNEFEFQGKFLPAIVVRNKYIAICGTIDNKLSMTSFKLVRFDMLGNIIFNKNFQNDYHYMVNNILYTKNNEFIIINEGKQIIKMNKNDLRIKISKINYGGNLVLEKVISSYNCLDTTYFFSINKVFEKSNNNIVLIGTFKKTNNKGKDLFCIKQIQIDQNCNKISDKNFEKKNFNYFVEHICNLTNNQYIIVGKKVNSINNNENIFLGKLSDGDLIWENNLPKLIHKKYVTSLLPFSENCFILTGYTFIKDKQYENWFVKINTNE